MERPKINSLQRVTSARLLNTALYCDFFSPTIIMPIWAGAQKFRQEKISLTNSGQHQSQGPNKISCNDQLTQTFIRQHQLQQS